MTTKSFLKQLGLFTLFFFTANTMASEGPMPALQVETTQVLEQRLVNTFLTTGTLQAESSAQITSEIPGRVISIHFKDGKTVEKNALLFKLEDTLLQADYRQTKARWELSKAQYERLEALSKKGSSSGSERDEALANLRVSEASLNALEARLSQTELRAPFSGFVGLSSVETGDYIVPGTPLVSIENIDTLKCDFKIPEIYLEKVRVGNSFSLMLESIPNKVFQGSVLAVSPHSETDTHSLVLRGRIENHEHFLKAGLLAKVIYELDVKEHALIIPETAIQMNQSGPFVYKVESNKALKTAISLGLRQASIVEVVSGLKKGDTIIVSGQNRLHDGANVQAKTSKQEKES